MNTMTCLAAFTAAAAVSCTASANTIRFRICGGPVVAVADGAATDLSLAPNIVKVSINTVVPWGIGVVSVKGNLVAIADPVVTGKPRITISNLVMTNVAGQVIAAPMWIEHEFTATTNNQFSARLAGRFDNVIAPGWLNGGSLTWNAKVRNSMLLWKTIASGGVGGLAGPAPIPFLFAGGPDGFKLTNLERQEFNFYLDSPGDSIIITAADASTFSAAWLLPAIGLPAAARRRRR